MLGVWHAQEDSELLVQYCAQTAITLDSFEWENPIWIVLFISFKPSLGLECSYACSSVTSATRARKFGRVVLQAWLDLQRTPRQPVLCPQWQESCSVWCQVSEPTLEDSGICLEPFAHEVAHRESEQVVLGVLKMRCLLITL